MLEKVKTIFAGQGFKRYFQNTSWLMGERILRMAIALTVGVLVTRYLGPEEFGVLSYAQSFVGLFAAFSSLGLTDIVTRELVKDKTDHYPLLGTAFILQTAGSVLIMLCLGLYVALNDHGSLTNTIILILGAMTFLQSFNVITTYFNSQVQSKWAIIPAFIGIVFSSILKLVGIAQDAPLLYFVWTLFFDVAFLTLGQLYFYKRAGFTLLEWKFNAALAKRLLRDAWPLILSTIVISIYMKIDQVMIKEMLSSASVGQYAAAVRLSEAWYFIPMIICTSLFPAILNAREQNEKLYSTRLSNLYDLMVILGLSIVLPVLLLADWGITFLYGPDFDQTASVLKIHIWAGIFVFLGVANQKWFISENLQSYNVVCLGLGMVLNIGLNLLWIPSYGIQGAALATLCSQAFASVLAPLFFAKTRPSFYRMLRSLLFVNILKKAFQGK
ncbi:flippase [Maribacter sp. 2307ULW6-5]|uniref:flippase n=1 Tax=Maribacter sp. 2307ULW6-5 TaxID=3386275 RepID=UPI0039BCBCF4